MKNGDRMVPEPGAIWMATASTEKYRILSVPSYKSIKLVVFHLADQAVEYPAIAQGIHLDPEYWQVDQGGIFKVTGKCGGGLVKRLWEDQGSNLWMIPLVDFMSSVVGPDGASLVRFLLIAEASLEEGDRVFIHFPTVQGELLGTVTGVEGNQVAVDADCAAIVTVERDFVVKIG